MVLVNPTDFASLATSFALKMLADLCMVDETYKQSINALINPLVLPTRAFRKTILMPNNSLLTNIRLIDITASKLSFSNCF